MANKPILLGNVDLEAVTNEDITKSGEMTDKPVEKGQNISDHYRPNSPTISLQGSIVSKDARDKLSRLEKYKEMSELITYKGKNTYKNIVIVSLNTRFMAENLHGFYYDILLQQPKISKPETFTVRVASPVTKQADKKTTSKVKAVTNTGRQQPILSKTALSDYNKMMMAERMLAYSPPGYSSVGGKF